MEKCKSISVNGDVEFADSDVFDSLNKIRTTEKKILEILNKNEISEFPKENSVAVLEIANFYSFVFGKSYTIKFV